MHRRFYTLTNMVVLLPFNGFVFFFCFGQKRFLAKINFKGNLQRTNESTRILPNDVTTWQNQMEWASN